MTHAINPNKYPPGARRAEVAAHSMLTRRAGCQPHPIARGYDEPMQSALPTPHDDAPTRKRLRLVTPGRLLIAATLLLCLVAIAQRAELRGRWWALRIAQATDPAQRAAHLQALMNEGPETRWGREVLLGHADVEVRRAGIISLQSVRADWAAARLMALRHDPDEGIRAQVALGLAIRGDDRIIPLLAEDYISGDLLRADLACLALERLATPAAHHRLTALADVPADPDIRGRLVDALESCPPELALPVLRRLVNDQRLTRAETRGERLARSLAAAPLAGWLAAEADGAAEAGPEAREIDALPTTTQQTTSSRTVASLAQSAIARLESGGPR